jgi:hypothetical protein
LRHLPRQRAQVLGPTDGHRVGKLGSGGSLQMYVLDLDEAIRVAAAVQQQVDATALVVAHLAPDHLVVLELRDPSGVDRLFDQAVGMHGVDADQAAFGLDQLQGQGQRPGRVARPGYPDRSAWRIEPEHAARVGAVHGDLAAPLQNHVGEETLVPAHQAPGEQRRRPAHNGI